MTQSHIDEHRPDTYWILSPDQIEVIASAVRMTLVDRLAADGPMSPEELAHAAALKPTAVYHHIKKLHAVGLVEIHGHRRQPGAKKPQTLYKTPAPRMRLIRAFRNPKNREQVSHAAAALLRQAERDFASAFEDSRVLAEGPQRNHGFFRVAARPDADGLKQINAHLEAIGEILWASNDPKNPPLALSWAIAPLPESNHDGDN